MWKTVKLGNVATVIAGQSPPSENYNKEGIGTPFMQGKKDYGDKFPNPPTVWTTSVTKLAEKGDILMSVRAPVGALNIANQQVCIGRGLAAIRATEDIEFDYLFYVLLQISTKLEGNAGAIFNSINKKQIEEIEVMLPPRAEQQRIVAKLDAAFAEIDTAIEATKAKQIEIGNVKSSALNECLAPDEDTVMWKTVKLGGLFKIGSSKRVLKADWRDHGVPFYRGREVTTLSKFGHVDNDLFISEEHYSDLSSNYGIPHQGDILVTAIGTIGNTYIVKEEDRFYFKDASVLWLHKTSEVDSKFVDYWFKSSVFSQQLDVGNGTTVDTLSITKLNNLDLSLPSLAEQQCIVAKLDAISKEVETANQAIIESEANYRALKSTILAQELQSEAA
tara:strand:+ start:340 stop:1509 length:1170 start_codon:yes stop_codon:yes gene_type:complete